MVNPANPRELDAFDFTTLSVTGKIVEFREGPSGAVGNDVERRVTATLVMVVDVTATGKGIAPSQVQVLLPRGAREISEFEQVMPAGTAVALYLSPSASNPDPEARQMFMPVASKGFAVDDGASVTYPLAHETVPNLNFAAVAPLRRAT